MLFEVVNTPINGGHLPTKKEVGRLCDLGEPLVTLESFYFNKIKKGIVRRTNKRKIMATRSYFTVTTKNEVRNMKENI